MRLIYRPIDTWPGELTTERVASQFTGDWSSTLEVLEREVSHLMDINPRTHHGPPELVLQLALPEGAIRQDGGIRAGSKPPTHPGVILNVDGKDGPLRFACDRFDSRWKGSHSESWRHNVRAIAFGLEALRKVERYGLGRGTEQYVGFQALPPGTPMPAAAMTVDDAAVVLHSSAGQLTASYFEVRHLLEDPKLVDIAYRSAVKQHHPDAGGDPEMFRRITEARDLLAAHHERSTT